MSLSPLLLSAEMNRTDTTLRVPLISILNTNTAYLTLLTSEPTQTLIDHTVKTVAEVVQRATTNIRHALDMPPLDFYETVSNLCSHPEVTTSMIILSLVYVERAEMYLPSDLGPRCFGEILLGCFTLAYKYLHGSALGVTEDVWAVDGTLDDLERSMLYYLQYELQFDEDDIINHLERVLAKSTTSGTPERHTIFDQDNTHRENQKEGHGRNGTSYQDTREFPSPKSSAASDSVASNTKQKQKSLSTSANCRKRHEKKHVPLRVPLRRSARIANIRYKKQT